MQMRVSSVLYVLSVLHLMYCIVLSVLFIVSIQDTLQPSRLHRDMP